MKKGRISRRGFLDARLLFGLGLCSAGLFLGLVAVGASSLTSMLGENSKQGNHSTVSSTRISSDGLADTANGVNLISFGLDERNVSSIASR